MRLNRRLVFLLAVFALPGCAERTTTTTDTRTAQTGASSDRPAGRPALAPTHPPIRIGAWNIEWLGTPGSRSGPAKGHAQTAEDLADYILAADVSILGLEEIARTDADDTWTNQTLADAFALVSQRTGGAWNHRLFPARSGRNQNTGIAWDSSRVTPVGEPLLALAREARAADGKPLWARPPYGQTFRAGPGLTDFVVIPLHMKSDYGGSFAAQRAAEAAALLADLPQTVHDGDVILIGDANCAGHAEPAVAALVEGGFVDLNAADQPTHIRYGPLDRAFVPAGQPEFLDRYFEVLRGTYLDARPMSEADFKVHCSDHFMVITRVTVMTDDD
jgi:hypothetical protein